MTLSQIIYSLIILLWVFWTYKTVAWIIKSHKYENVEVPFYVGFYISVFILLPLIFVISWAFFSLTELIFNNWNTKII